MGLLNDAERHPITTILIVGAVATSIAQETGRSVEHMILTPLDALTEPWRYLTTIFPHGGAIHLIFNVFWIWQLGRAIESRLGTLPMIGLTVVAALAASGTEVLMYNAAIGLSGVVYAFAMFAWARGRHDPKYRGVIDTQTLQLLVGWFFLCIIATETGFMRIANGAHAGGAAIGFLLGLKRPWFAPAFLAGLAAMIFMRLGQGSLQMPPRVIESRAVDALVADRNQEGIDLYEQLFATGHRSAASFYNYGLALSRVGREAEGMTALIQAYDLDPQIIQDVETREMVMKAWSVYGPGR